MINKKVSDYITVSAIGLHLISGIIAGLLLGYFFDNIFNTHYKLTIIFIFLGILTGFYNMYKDAVRYIKEEEKESKSDRNS